MWIDSHCHLEPADFRAEDGTDERDAVIERARQAGVTRLIVVGSGHGRSEIDTALAFAHRYPNIFAAIGVHCHDAHVLADETTPEASSLWQAIEQLAQDQRVVAVGESGLDYFYKNSTPEQQQHVMRRFLRISASVKKPISLHIRDAHDDARRIVREESPHGHAPGGVVHCFTGSADDARRWLDLGFHISLSGIVTFKNAVPIREAARIIPPDRLLLETDCPFLAPVPLRGKRNEPALLVHTAQVVAELRGTSLPTLADETRTATERLFALPPLA